MGIFDRDDSSDEEVAINPDENTSTASRNESKLKSEVESKVVPGSNKSSEESSSSTVSSVASGSTVSNKGSSKNISVEDVYRQNERIIELLEGIAGEENNNDNNENSSSEQNEEFDGDLNGVL